MIHDEIALPRLGSEYTYSPHGLVCRGVQGIITYQTKRQQMKKLILLTLALTNILVNKSWADLGDSIEQSYARYGKAAIHDNNSYCFHLARMAVSEWVNPLSNKVEFIAYFKKGQKITKQEYAQICGENLPAYLVPDSEWNIGTYQTKNDHDFADSKSKDGVYWIQFGKDRSSNPYLAYLCIGFSATKDQATKEWHYLYQKQH